MKTLNTLLSFSFLCLGLAARSGSTPDPKVVKLDPPRSVIVDERTPAVDIYVAPFQNVLLVLPHPENIMNNFQGNTADWTVQSTKVAGPFVSVKIKHTPAPSTTLTLVSDRKRSYTFRLIQSDDHSDSKVFLEANAELAEEIKQQDPWISPEEGANMRRQLEQAKADVEKAKQNVESEVNAFKSHYPSTIKFPFQWNQHKGRDMGIKMIFIDGQGFTRISADPDEAPALYEVKDGKPSQVDAPLQDGLYTVTKIVRHGYLAVGKKQVDFDWPEAK